MRTPDSVNVPWIRAALLVWAVALAACSGAETSPEAPAPLGQVEQAGTTATVRWMDVSFRGTRPSATSSYALAWDSGRGRLMAYGGLRPTGRHDEVWEYDGAEWRYFNMNGDWPAPRTQPVWVYDPVGERTLLFGGTDTTTFSPPSESIHDDLWSWDGQGWQELPQGAVRPQPLQKRLGVFDPERNRLLVFGGFSEVGPTDTGLAWEYDPATGEWASIAATGIGGVGNVPRSVTWDSTRHQVIGVTSSEVYDAQLAVWDPNAGRWSPLLSSGMTATAFDAPTLVYDPVTDSVVVWGDGLAYRYDMVGQQIAVFEPEKIGGGPAIDHAPREVAPIVHDGAHQRLLAMWEGGLFALDGDGWRNITPDGVEQVSPARRRGYAVAAHPVRQSVVLFGGRNQEQAALEVLMPGTWEWDGATWQRRASAEEPAPRVSHDMEYLPSANHIVLFGGRGSDGGCLDDTWTWDGTGWTNATPQAGEMPSPRRDHAMAYDPGANQVLLFGGRNCDNTQKETYSDLWSWDGDAWHRVMTTGTPPAGRHGHDMVTAGGGIALLGGSDWVDSRELGEHWQLSGGVWGLLGATRNEGLGPVSSGAAAWDATDDKVLYFHDNRVDVWHQGAWVTVRDDSPETNASLFGLNRMWPATGGQQKAHEVADLGWLGVQFYWNWENFESRTVLWDGTWREVTPPLSATPVHVPVPQVAEPELIGALDPTRGVVVLYRLPLSADLPGRTWLYDVAAGTWTETTPEWRDVAYLDTLAGFPDVRRGASLVWDGREIRLLGGEGNFSNDTMPATANSKYDFETGRWNRITAGEYPARSHASFVSRGGPDVVIFGGHSGNNVLNDTWRCDHNVFPRDCAVFPNSVEGAPPARFSHAMAWSTEDDLGLLFGGVSATSTLLADTWILDDAGWRPLEGRHCAPSRRSRHAMAWVPSARVFVLYGGQTRQGVGAARPVGDAWVFNLETERWILHPPPRPLPPRFGHTMITTPDGQVLALSGAGTGAAPHETLAIDVSLVPLPLAPEAQIAIVDQESTVAFPTEGLPAGASLVLPSLPDGAVFDAGTATLTWTPTEAQLGTHELVVAAEGEGFCVDDTLTVEVRAFANTPPVAEDQAIATARNVPVTFALMASDADGHPLTYRLVDGPSLGTATLDGATVTYTPELDALGDDTFTWVANDGFDDSNTATVTLSIRPVNTAPTIADQRLSTPEDTPLTIDPMIVDPDTDDVHTVTLETSPEHGEVVVEGTSLRYSPATDFHGEDRFVIQAHDGASDSGPATIIIDVTPVNDPPVANDLAANVEANGSVDITLAANDVEDDALTFAITVQPEHGEVTLSDNMARYTPDADYVGEDRFTFSVSDGEGLSDEGVVTLTVVPGDGGGDDDNHPPVLGALNDVSVVAGQPLTLQLEATDADGDALTFTVEGAGDDATLDAATGAFTWTPSTDDIRAWEVTFTVSDGEASDSATITVEVVAGDGGNTAKAGGTESPGCDCATTQGRPSAVVWLFAALALAWWGRRRG